MIITIANEKGGVAKTTSCAALGSVLSSLGHTVLVVDLDSQSDLTVSLNVEPGERNIFDCIFEHRNILAKNINKNLVLVGGSPKMNPIDFTDQIKKDSVFQFKNTRLILEETLGGVREKIDFILLDCPPNLDLITQNALACSDYLLVPTESHSFSINGISAMLEYAEKFVGSINEKLRVLGIFLTRFRDGTNMHSEIQGELARLHPRHMLETVIHENVTAQEATHVGMEFVKYGREKAKKHPYGNRQIFRALEDYQKLVEEILNKIKRHES